MLLANITYGAPALQLYLEGGTYNETTESWELTPEGSSGGEPLRLWAIGSYKEDEWISDVRLSVAYLASDLGLEITMTPAQIGGTGSYLGIDDPSLSSVPTKQTLVETSLGPLTAGDEIDGIVAAVEVDGATVIINENALPMLGDPELGNQSPLPAHDIFGPGVVWQEFLLGDFALHDSHIGDFIGGFPTELEANGGQINAYDISVIGGSGATLHFDLYDSIMSKNRAKARFAPFSHDGDGDVNVVPEPTSVFIWLLVGSFAVVLGSRRYR